LTLSKGPFMPLRMSISQLELSTKSIYTSRRS
jgi:hypothetical protein